MRRLSEKTTRFPNELELKSRDQVEVVLHENPDQKSPSPLEFNYPRLSNVHCNSREASLTDSQCRSLQAPKLQSTIKSELAIDFLGENKLSRLDCRSSEVLVAESEMEVDRNPVGKSLLDGSLGDKPGSELCQHESSLKTRVRSISGRLGSTESLPCPNHVKISSLFRSLLTSWKRLRSSEVRLPEQ